MSVYELSIDPTGAEAGAERIVKSFDKIKASASAMSGAASSSFGRMADAYKQLSNMRGISEQTVNSLRAFSQVMREFRGPSAASVENTKKFLNVLNALSGFRAPSANGLAAFLRPLAEFKGPSAASAANTTRLLGALGRLGALPAVGRGFTNFLAELGAFRGPGANASRNTAALLQVLSGFRPSSGLGTTITRLREIAAAAEAARIAMERLAGARGPTPPPRPGPAGGGGGGPNPRDLTRQYGALETAILRTQTAMNALGGVLGIKFIAEASNNVIKIRSQLEAATGSVQQGRVQFQFLEEQSRKLGLEFVSTAKSYGMLLASLKGTNVTFQEAQDIFKGFSTASRALQLSASDVDGVFRALGQIMSKGKLQAEELRGQLGDRLPGAFTRFAVALNMTKPGQLDKALKDGAISGDKLKNAILQVSKTLEIEFSQAATKAATTVDSAFNRLKNAFTFESADFGARGFNQALIEIANTLTALIQSNSLNQFFGGLAVALKFAAENIDIIVKLIGVLVISSFLKWASAITVASGALTSLTGIMVALRAFTLGQFVPAMVILRGVILANPFIALGAAIVGVTSILMSFTTKLDEARQELISSGSASALAQNAMDAYNARVGAATGTQDEFTAAIRRSIDAQRALAMQSYGTTTELGGNKSMLRKFIDTGMSGPGDTGERMPAELMKELRKIGDLSDDGRTFKPRLLDRDSMGRPLPAQQQIRNARVLARTVPGLKRYAETLPENSTLRRDLLNQANMSSGYLGQFDEARVAAGGKKPTFSLLKDVYEPVYGDLNKSKTTPAISGDVPEKVKRDSAAASAAKSYASDIARAVAEFKKLDVAVAASASYVSDVLSGVDSLSAKARQSATEKVNSLEATFSDENKNKGLIEVAQKLGLVATNADTARASLVSYRADLEKTRLQSEATARAGDRILDLERENDVRERYINNVIKSGTALLESNRNLEIERQLLDTVGQARADLSKRLEEQMLRQEALNRAEEIGKAAEAARLYGAETTSTLKGYSAGLTSDEMGRYKELASYVDELNKSALGYNATQIDFLTELKTAQLALAAALQEVDNQYEAVRNRAQDDADAITQQLRGIFGVGTDTAKTFGQRIKELFKSLKDSFLDFAIFNPIKKWLTDSLTGTYGKSSPGLTSAIQNATEKEQNLRSVAKDAATVMDEALQPLTATGGAADKILSGATKFDAAVDRINAKPEQGVAAAALGGVGGPYESAYGSTEDRMMDQAKSGAAFLAGQLIKAMPNGYDSSKEDAFRSGIGGQGAVVTQSDVTESVIKATKPIMKAVAPGAVVAANTGLFTQIKNNLTAKKDENGLTPIKAGFADIKDAFSGKKSISARLGSAVDGIAKIGGEIFKAATTFITVRDTLSSKNGLNTSDTVASTIGGAAAGYQLGSNFGPIGGAIGMAAGGILGFLSDVFSKGRLANTQVVVGANGIATVGETYKQGKGDTKASQGLASGAAKLFNDFANAFNSDLKVGNYGSFGVQKKDRFYSVTGQIDRKGRPVGKEGVDYFYESKGNDLQGIALKTQLNKGQFPGLSETLQTIGRNTQSATVDGIQQDLQVGVNYDAFVDAAKKGSQLTKTVADLGKAYSTLRRQSMALGVAEDKLTRARDAMLKSYREEFDYTVSQEILKIKDPVLAAYNDLVKEYKQAVGDAQAVGGNLANVEQLYGLKRVELLKQSMEAASDAIANGAKALLDQLTGTTSSPLSPTKVLENASSNFFGLQAQIRGGDLSNIDNLSNYSQSLIDASQEVYKSSTDFFSIFDNVTNFLREIADGGYSSAVGGATNASNLPELPGLSAIMAELATQNDELLGVTKSVGVAIVEGNEVNAELLRELIRVQDPNSMTYLGNGFEYQYKRAT